VGKSVAVTGDSRALHGDGKYVVYWMIAARRLEHNLGLDLALQHCRNLN
jgi:hypothetical protein